MILPTLPRQLKDDYVSTCGSSIDISVQDFTLIYA